MIDLSLLEDFVEGAGESLDEMESALLELETDLNNIELFNTIFRAMHTIKGAAQFVGLDKVSALSHVLEDLLDVLRNGKKQANVDIVNLFIQAKDRISALIADLERSQTEETEVDDLIEKIKVHLNSDAPVVEAPVVSVINETNAAEVIEESSDNIADFLTDDGEENYQDLFKADDNQDQVSSFLFEDSTESLESSFTTNHAAENDLASFLTEQNPVAESQSEEATLHEEQVPSSSVNTLLAFADAEQIATPALAKTADFSNFVIPDEEYDQELFTIFISQLQEKITLLNACVGRLKVEENINEILKVAAEAIDSLRFSANYMGYEQLTYFYVSWLEHLTQVQKEATPTFGFMRDYLLQLGKIFPQLEKNTPPPKKEIPLAVQIERMVIDKPAPVIDKVSEKSASFEAAVNKLEAVPDAELAFITDLIDVQTAKVQEPELLVSLTEEVNESEEKSQAQDEDLFQRLSYALDATIAQTISSAPINELFGSLLTATKEEQSRAKAQKDSELALEIKTLAQANQEPPALVEKEVVPKVELDTALGQQKPVLTVHDENKTNLVETAKKPKAKAEADKVFKKSIRVDADKIDSLMNQVGELIVDRAYFFQLANEINQLHQYLKTATGLGQKELKPVRTFAYRFGEAIISLGRTSNELQEGVMKIRMLPISQIFNRYPRLVHDLANTKGKKVQLEIRGEDTELDKMIIEEISDPLIHMIRNAIGHGLETPDVRKQMGKPEIGTLILEAYHESNHIVIEVTDDGRGIDTERIKIKAEELNLFTREELNRMSKDDLTRFIMMPGFSTAKEIDSTSGRGVGMDVVKKNIEKLNGTIEVESKVGIETKVRLKIPLTLAIIQALLVNVSNDWFTIPLANVEETLRVVQDEISIMEETEVMYLRGKTLPIFRLATLFNLKSGQNVADTEFFVVVVNTGNQRVGLMVDSLIGQEEVVIKPLVDYLHEKNCFSGATIVGDGRISLILDVYELVEMTTNKQIKRHEAQEKGSLVSLQDEM